LKTFSFVRGGGALLKIATQGCDLRARFATCSESRDSRFQTMHKQAEKITFHIERDMFYIFHLYEPRVRFL
jgi:hypothetical protein